MAKRAKVDISDEKFEEALSLKAQGKPKTVQCAALGIAYNTTRLEALLVEYLEKKEQRKALRERRKKEAITQDDVTRWVTEYVLEGDSISSIAERACRTEPVVRYHIEKAGALFVRRGIDQLNTPIMPEEAISTNFEIGELVWVAKYGCMGEVRGFLKDAVKVYAFGDGIQEFTFQPVWEIGSLRHLVDMKVPMSRAYDICLTSEDCRALINEALEKLFKQQKGKS